MHDLAHRMINLGVKLEEKPLTFNMYVNDAIGFRMTSEQILFYSANCYGTADTISFRHDLLRISDLKTGVNEVSHRQLEVYAALFCLEYRFKPFDIGFELRIYQNDDVRLFIPEPDEIIHIMEKIKSFDKHIDRLREEVL